MMLLERCEEFPVPSAIKVGTLYLKPNGYTAHRCPCGNHLVIIPTAEPHLQTAVPPVWGLAAGENGPTITPSIRNLDCGEHYFITDGNIVAC